MHRVCIIGSGNWGTTIAKLIGENIKNEKMKSEFDQTIRFYVGKEMVNEKPLSDIINNSHEDVKYMQGVILPDNVKAYNDIEKAAEGAYYLVFVTRGESLPELLEQIKSKIANNASGISVMKGITLHEDSIELIPEIVEKILNIPCGGLSGANMAKNIAFGQLTEATIAFKDPEIANKWLNIFNCSYFKCRIINDIYFQQLLGTLKNVIALGADFVDGMGFGENTKAAVLRIGLKEMYKFACWYYPDKNVNSLTLLESCGFADLIATAYADKNRKCAVEFIKAGKDWNIIEKEILHGKKLQATVETNEIYRLLEKHNCTNMFPLISKIYKISHREIPVTAMFQLQKIF